MEAGDFATIVGSNGAGKSTLFNAITGGFIADEGSITLGGEDITFAPEYQRSRVIGHLFQDPLKGTAPNMTIEENLALAYLRAGTAPNAIFSRISRKDKEIFREKLALLDMGLEDRIKQPVGLLSGGQRQALTLLMATLVTPKLLLLDEHTAALDPATAEKVLDLTKSIVAEKKITCLMVTHNMHQALELGNRTLMMDAGRIVFDVKGEARSKMTVDDLLEKFRENAGHLDSDPHPPEQGGSQQLRISRKTAAKQLSEKNNEQNPEPFQSQDGLKRVPGFVLFLYILQHLGEECLQTRMLGVGEQFLRRLILLDPSLVNEDDAVGDFAGKAHLMGDHQHGDAGVSQLFHQLKHFTDHLGVEGAGRLIEEDDVRVHCQCACDGDALLLAARKALGVGVGLVGQTYAGQKLVGAFGNGFFVLEWAGWGASSGFSDGQVGEEVEVLEHHAHLLADRVDVVVVHLHALKFDAAAGGDLQPVQAAQEGGFAAARGADKADHVAAVDVDVDAPQHVQSGGSLLCALPLFAAVGLGQAPDFQDLIGHFVPASSQILQAAR